MKTKISHLGRSTVSVILAVMMLLSTMLVGTVSTVNAVTSITSDGSVVFYFNPKPSSANDWSDASAKLYVYFFNDSGNAWSDEATVLDSSHAYVKIPSGTFTNFILARMNPNPNAKGNPDWDNQWGQTNDISISALNGNYVSDFGYKSSDIVSSNYIQTSTAKLDADNTSVTEGTAVTLTPSLTSNTDFNDIKSVSYSVKKDSVGASSSDYSIEGSKITFKKAGNYEVTANVMYNAKGFSNITKTTTATTTITVESSLPHVAQSVSLTASPETVTSGGSTKLTATLTNKATGVDKVTYTFKKADGTVVGTVTDSPKDTASVDVANITSDTKYTVTVSAAEHSDVTANTSVTVKQLENWYLMGSVYGTWNDLSTESNENFRLKYDSATGCYYYDTTLTNTNDDVYFRFHNGTSQFSPPNNNEEITLGGNKYSIAKTNVSDNAFKYSNPVSNYRIWLDSSNANDIKVWITDITKKYNISNDSGKELTISPNQASAGEKVTVTATPTSGEVLKSVTVVGENGSTPIETTVSGNSATFTMPDQDVIVKDVTFRNAETYTVTFRSSDDKFGTVSATNGKTPISSSPATVTEGDEVTFTATPKKGYAFESWTVNGVSASSTANPYKITVDKDTTVVANFKVEDSGTIVKNKYFLYGSTDDPRKWEGMQAYDKQGYGKYDVYEKDGKYIVTLNREHYKQLFFAFSTSDYYLNMVPNASLNDVKAENPEGLKLVEAGIQQYNTGSDFKYGKMNIVSENSDNIGDIKIIYDPEAQTYTVKATKDSVSDTTVNIVGKDGTIRAGYTDNDDKKTTAVLGDTELSITTPDKEIIDAPPSYPIDGKNRAVTAKRVPYGSTVTVKTTINPEATFAGHSGSDYYVKGFSINGFTGGVLTQQAGNEHTSDVYEYTFTVNKDVYADVSTIEITPIYFLKNDSDCITFYVENFMDAKAKWGDTIACYAYYNSDHALGDYPGQPMVNAEGSIYMQIPKHIGDNKSNVVKGITLNNYVWDYVHVSDGSQDNSVRKSKNCQTYDYDDFKYLANMSKVNSSDSAADIKNIVYRFKYHTYNNTSADAGNVPKDTLTGTTVDNTKYEVFVDYYDKPTDIFGTIIKGKDAVTVDTVKAESEYLTIVSDGYVNYYNDTANYLGQYATKWYIYNKEDQQVAALPPSALLYGLTKSSDELKTLVKQEAVPQDFMSDSGANTDLISNYWTSFKSLYNSYAGKYAIINYESAIHSSGRDNAENQPGERCDGRWYYSVDKAKITGDIRIEYADTLDSFTKMTGVKTDKFKSGTATGTITAAEAFFTSPVDQSTGGKPTHVETTSDNSANFMFTVGATSSTTSGYTFVGWYRLIDDTYKAVNDPSELNKTTGQVARNANVVLVARYIKTPGGSMTFQHSLYTGENAGGGKATTKIQVVVKSSGGKEYYNSGIIDSTASIDQETIREIVADQQGAKITVTLYTTTKNLYNFNGYYSAENTTDITAFKPTSTPVVSGDRKNGLVTKLEYTFSFNEYYNKYAGILTATDAGTVYYNFYSDITSIKVPYKVQFSYKDRMEKQKYYNRAGYVDPENTSSYTFVEKNTGTNGEGSNAVEVTLTDSFILSLAPYESNFTKNLTWDKTPVSNTAFDSSVTNSIASAVVNSDQSPRTIHLNVYRDDKGVPTPRTNTKGHFELFTRNNSPELPYGSVFYEQKSDGTYKYDITAEKTYTDEDGTHQFMYWAIYSDSNCEEKDLVIKAYNSEGHFSYVAYDNCWIVPVYEESSTPSASVKKVYTTTQFMEVTRNQWTAENADSFTGFDVDTMTTLKDFKTDYGEDKLYADFVLNFFYNGKQLSVFDPNSEQVKAGVLIQRLDLDRNDTTGYITDLNHYAKKYDETELEQAKNDAIDKITTGTSAITSVIQQIDNNRLDNKNRLQYYTRFNNVVDNSNYVFRLYTYIQYTDADGQSVVELSNPVYFTFYDIANK